VILYVNVMSVQPLGSAGTLIQIECDYVYAFEHVGTADTGCNSSAKNGQEAVLMRLFIAIELPADAKNELGRLRVDIPGARWVPSDQIHLTLAFLGEVDEAALERLTGQLARIQMTEFRVRFARTGCFPDHQRPRVLWVGLEPEPRLNTLAARVRDAVLACGIPQEERPFSPHITLARIKLPSPGSCDAFLDRDTRPGLPPLHVREFILFQSRLTQQGALHIPVRGFPLAI
jgi:2'-5' RNA ligase